jgi:hypothetical protein
MRPTLLVGACAVALVACQSDREPVAQSRAGPTPAEAILAIEAEKLVELDSRTLLPAAGRSASLAGFRGAVAFSPDGRRVAVGGTRAVRVVDLASMQIVTDLPKPRGYTSVLSWPRPGRLLVVNEVEGRAAVEAFVLNAASGRILVRRRLEARSWAFGARQTRAAVFLLHPPAGIGPVRLAHFDARGRLRLARLERIPAGQELDLGDVFPALAVDDEGRRAFVVGGEDVVAEVDLGSFRISYHSLQESSSIVERLRNWLEPTAEAKASDFTQFGALWLENDMLAVTGVRTSPYREDGALRQRDQPLGLRLVNTESWDVRTVDEDARWVARAGDLLLAYASLWDSADAEVRGIGLRAYTLEGERRFHALGNRPIDGVFVVGGRAFAILADSGDAAVVDLRAGKVVRTFPVDETSTGIPDIVLRPG